MAKNIEHIQHIKSNVVENGGPKLPNPSALTEGEIAINYAEGVETISIKNSRGDVVTFSSDNYFINEKSGFKRVTNPTANTNVGLVNSLSQYYDTNIGKGAVIEGDGNNNDYKIIASGDYSHAEGQSTTASGESSHVEGYYTVANNPSEHASGRYNVSSSASTTFGDSGNTLFSVGNGSDTTRHNAFEIRQNGDIYISSGGTNTSQMIKLQDNIGIDVVTAITSSNSGSTNPIATKVVAENEETVSNALNDLNARVAALEAALGGMTLVKLTSAQYEALTVKDPNTLYVIND